MTIHFILYCYLARAVHLTLVHVVDEGQYLFRSPLEADLLFKVCHASVNQSEFTNNFCL